LSSRALCCCNSYALGGCPVHALILLSSLPPPLLSLLPSLLPSLLLPLPPLSLPPPLPSPSSPFPLLDFF